MQLGFEKKSPKCLAKAIMSPEFTKPYLINHLNVTVLLNLAENCHKIYTQAKTIL